MYLIVDENADLLHGAGEGVVLLPAARYGFFLFLKEQAGFALACGFVKGALFVKTFFFGIAARASSKRSAALSDLRIAF